MKNIIKALISVSLIFAVDIAVANVAAGFNKDVNEDASKFQNYALKNYPKLSLQDFQNGPYAFNADKYQQFEAIMEFPPYEDFLEKGAASWNKPFKNGKTFASCLGSDVSQVRPSYPKWNAKAGKVVTLERAIQDCLIKNNESKWGWKKGKMAYLSAFLTNEAKGQLINVIIPDDPKAKAAYDEGKKFYYAKRGQLNLSCANCHVEGAGKRIRGNTLSSAVGHVTHFPVWRGKWARSKGDGFGTLHRRFGGCNKQVRAKPFRSQGKEYSNLEYFLTAMSNGMAYSGTAYRE